MRRGVGAAAAVALFVLPDAFVIRTERWCW